VYFALPGFSLKPGDVVIDLGANVGVFTTLAARLASRVIAVDAQSGYDRQIGLNVERNGCAHKVSVDIAIVGERSGYFSDPDRLKSGSWFGETPPALSMTDLLHRHNIHRVDFLKVDI